MHKIPDQLIPILESYEAALKKREEFELGFNIFSLVSDTYYKENFHSQIISTFLNPEGSHKEGRIYLDLFLKQLGFETSNYTEGVKVYNEASIANQRRIDILIESKSNAIIIENKIYNAGDMDNQLIDYYRHCKKKGLTIDSIIYLSLDGVKSPDKSKWHFEADEDDWQKEIESKLLKKSAFDTSANSSIYHWLDECAASSTIENNKFIIKQYKQLLKSLRGYIMETDSLEKYYEFISNPNNSSERQKIQQWVELHAQLPLYYTQRFMNEIERDNSLKHLYSTMDPIPGYATTVIFHNIASHPHYYLKVYFQDNYSCNFHLRDNSETWQKNELLESNHEFTRLFDRLNDRWNYKKGNYDLVNEFDKFMSDFKSALIMIDHLLNPSDQHPLSQ